MFSCHIAAVFSKKYSTRPTVHYHLAKEPDIFLRTGGDQNQASSRVNVELRKLLGGQKKTNSHQIQLNANVAACLLVV